MFPCWHWDRPSVARWIALMVSVEWVVWRTRLVESSGTDWLRQSFYTSVSFFGFQRFFCCLWTSFSAKGGIPTWPDKLYLGSWIGFISRVSLSIWSMEWAVGSLYAQYVPLFFISLACSLCSDVTLFLQAKKQLCQSAINEGVLAKLPVTVRVTFICPCCKWKNNVLLPNPL